MTAPAYPSCSLWSLRRRDTDPLAFLQGLARTADEVVPFRLGTRPAFLLNHPAAIEDVLLTHHDRFVKGRGFERAKRLLGDGLLTAGATLHAARRRVAQPAFHRQRIEGYAPSIVAHAARWRDRWQPGVTLDAGREMRRLTLSIAGETLFGADLAEVAEDIDSAVAEAVPAMDGLVSIAASRRHARTARLRLDAIVNAIVERRLRDNGARDDLLSLLLDARGDDEAAERQLRDDAITFLLAGHDTIAHALTWTWTLLAQHPDVEARLQAELATVLPDRLASAHDVSRLVYTRSVLAEALRVFPPAWVIVRRAAQPHACRGYRMPAGSVVVASPFVTHRDPRFFPDPLAFSPERWLSSDHRPRLAYFPFGAGPRSCIGEGFAWMEGTLVLATLAARWRLRSEGGPVEPSPRITLRPRGPVQMVPLLVR
ncbi:MAG: cytochrome P450 [Acidobacteria bacterium]|nr:cytochrome P450 [Acidobacteriota bacterium]